MENLSEEARKSILATFEEIDDKKLIKVGIEEIRNNLLSR